VKYFVTIFFLVIFWTDGYIMETLGNTIFTSKISNFFVCNLCDFKCYKSGDLNRHIKTRKHLNRCKMETEGNNFTSKFDVKPSSNITPNYMCEICNLSYKSRAGLWKHKQKCNGTKEENEYSEKGEIKLLTHMFLELVKQLGVKPPVEPPFDTNNSL
jgi:hypothetical protein